MVANCFIISSHTSFLMVFSSRHFWWISACRSACSCSMMPSSSYNRYYHGYIVYQCPQGSTYGVTLLYDSQQLLQNVLTWFTDGSAICLSDDLKWCLVASKGGKLGNAITHNVTGQSQRLNLFNLFIAGYAHLQCLMLCAFPYLSNIGRHFERSGNTLINISTERLKWHAMIRQMRKSNLCQLLHVHVNSITQTIQLSSWLKWCWAFWRDWFYNSVNICIILDVSESFELINIYWALSPRVGTTCP